LGDRRQGDTVSFAALITLSNYVPLTLLDANRNVRTLQSYERFILDSLVVDGDQQGIVQVVSNTNNTSASNPPVISVDTSNTSNPVALFIPSEGISFPVGVTPYITGEAGGWATGTGRIVAQTQVGRQNWREAIVPAGTPLG
jgi:hypothetical protein